MKVIEKINIKSFITSKVKGLIKIIIKIYMIICNKLYGVDDNKIVFTSFSGKSYSDNPRAISEKLHEIVPDFKIIWLFKEPQKKKNLVPDYVTCLKVNSISAYKTLATSKFWVDNFCKPLYMYKSNNQVYIQTWHGDRGFKKILHDSPFVSTNYKIFESNNCDLIICGSDYGERKYRTAFRYNGAILKYGCPRNDVLIRNSEIKKEAIKNHLGIKSNINILLYAPTLRREAVKSKKPQSIKDIDLSAVLKLLEDKTKKEWICLVRAHSAVKGLSGIPDDLVKFIDVTSYEDMNELLLISDFLITDYSSSAGDFALLNRPIVLFQPDRLDYIKRDRTFYFNLDDSPFIIAQNNEALLEIICNLEWDLIPQNCKEILDFYGTIETGEASKKVVDYIINH
ncbi:MAG: hypothetical protein GX201_13575 [Clostridiales bacterium]|nr:hypothetical protein [Clostridiales bacterium]